MPCSTSTSYGAYYLICCSDARKTITSRFFHGKCVEQIATAIELSTCTSCTPSILTHWPSSPAVLRPHPVLQSGFWCIGRTPQYSHYQCSQRLCHDSSHCSGRQSGSSSFVDGGCSLDVCSPSHCGHYPCCPIQEIRHRPPTGYLHWSFGHDLRVHLWTCLWLGTYWMVISHRNSASGDQSCWCWYQHCKQYGKPSNSLFSFSPQCWPSQSLGFTQISISPK